MSEPYLGEIRLLSFTFAPKGWAMCNGALLPINQNQALFSLLGTNYGGDGRVTFALPDLRGRVAMGASASYPLGVQVGEYAHTLTPSEMPAHTHAVTVAAAANATAPTGSALLAQPGKAAYSASAAVAMNPQSVSNVGGSQPHENTAPYLSIQFAIALVGVFPSQN